jgi:hypothetical protein
MDVPQVRPHSSALRMGTELLPRGELKGYTLSDRIGATTAHIQEF